MKEDIRKENDRKKEFLWSYLEAKKAVIRAEEELLEIRLNKMYPSVINDGMPHGSNQNDLSAYIVTVKKVEQKILKKRYIRIQTFKRVRDCIEAVHSEDEKSVLFYHYIRGMSWEKIAEKMDYCVSNIYKIHGKALFHFELPKECSVL